MNKRVYRSMVADTIAPDHFLKKVFKKNLFVRTNLSQESLSYICIKYCCPREAREAEEKSPIFHQFFLTCSFQSFTAQEEIIRNLS